MSKDLESLAKSVFGGELGDAAPLYDLLLERGDRRAAELAMTLGLLAESYAKQAARWSPSRGRTEEERTYRLDEAARQAWRNFAGQFRISFWTELYGPPDAAALRTLGVTLKAKKQAERFAKRGADDGPGGMLVEEGGYKDSAEGELTGEGYS